MRNLELTNSLSNLLPGERVALEEERTSHQALADHFLVRALEAHESGDSDSFAYATDIYETARASIRAINEQLWPIDILDNEPEYKTKRIETIMQMGSLALAAAFTEGLIFGEPRESTVFRNETSDHIYRRHDSMSLINTTSVRDNLGKS